MRGSRVARGGLLACLLLVLLPGRPAAHEVPNDVLVRAFIKPEEGRLSILVRVPLEAVRDVPFPTSAAGYLDLPGTRPYLVDAATLWIAGYLRVFEDGRELPQPTVTGARLSLPSDRSFTDFERAAGHMNAPPLRDDLQLPWRQALLDVRMEVPVASRESRFSIEPTWAHLGLTTVTILRFLPAEGTERVLQYSGDPGLLRLDPRWYQAAWSFVSLGFQHILEGIDHILFLLCLVVPMRSFWRLVPVVTAFTLAHSITLVAAAFGLAPGGLWFPPLIETLIAASIVYMALENILSRGLEHRWVMAFAFGLVHGFGFSFLLSESLQFAGSHLLASLLAFNVGVEAGQLAFLAVALPALVWLFRRVPERAGVIVLSAILAHTGWHWMTERGARVLEYQVVAPVWDARFGAGLLRWLILAIVILGSLMALRALVHRLRLRQTSGHTPSAPAGVPGDAGAH